MELFKLFGSVMIENKDAIASLNKVDKKGKTTGKKLGDMADKGLKVGAAVVAGAGVAVGGLMTLANGTADTADKWDKLSLRTGIAVENLQRWGYAAEQSGADITVLETGIKKMSDTMVDAKNGTEASQEAYKALGISMADLAKMTPEQAFDSVMNGLAEMEDGALKNSIGNDLLGKSYVELKPLIAEGADGMNDLKNRADELGIVMSEDAVNSGVVFGDTLADVKSSLDGAKNGIMVELMPKLTEMLNWVIAHMPEIKETMSNVFDKISEVITFATDNINILIPVLGLFLASMLALKVISIVTAIMAAWSTVTTIATAVGGAFGAVLAFITSPIGLVVLAIAGLIAIGVLLYKNWDVVKQKASQLWEGIKKAFTAVIDFVKKNWQGLLLLLLNPFAGAFKLIYDNNEKFRNTINKFVNGIKSKIGAVFGKIKDVMTKPFTKAKEIIKGVIDKIKGFLSFKWKFPKLKMPHFSVTGSMNPLKWIEQGLPKLGVKWYKDGGIFSKPTLFNTPYGMKGVGEAGAEVVAPLSDLKGMINDGISRAIAPLFLNQQSSQPIVVENNILTSDGWIYKAVQRAQKREDGRYYTTKRV